MAMSKKHYRAFADILYGARSVAVYHNTRTDNPDRCVLIERIAEEMCDVFKKDNSAFDYKRFLIACGVIDE